MFLPENQKKLTNISIVTLKKFGRKYELAVFPNKLYEYRNNPAIGLGSVLQTESVYRSVATGEVCSEADVALLGSRAEAIGRILREGHEQKATATAQHEQSQAERQIVELVQGKVKYKGGLVSKENLERLVRNMQVSGAGAKRQVSGVVRKLEEAGFERVSFVVTAGGEEHVVRSDELPGFIEEKEREGVKCVVKREEGLDEEIC